MTFTRFTCDERTVSSWHRNQVMPACCIPVYCAYCNLSAQSSNIKILLFLRGFCSYLAKERNWFHNYRHSDLSQASANPRIMKPLEATRQRFYNAATGLYLCGLSNVTIKQRKKERKKHWYSPVTWWFEFEKNIHIALSTVTELFLRFGKKKMRWRPR